MRGDLPACPAQSARCYARRLHAFLSPRRIFAAEHMRIPADGTRRSPDPVHAELITFPAFLLSIFILWPPGGPVVSPAAELDDSGGFA